MISIEQYLIVWGFKDSSIKQRTAIEIVKHNTFAIDMVMKFIFKELHKQAKKEGFSEDEKVIYEIYKL